MKVGGQKGLENRIKLTLLVLHFGTQLAARRSGAEQVNISSVKTATVRSCMHV